MAKIVEGMKINRTDLEAAGWKYVLLFGKYLLLFKKRDKRLIWNSKQEVVDTIYNYNQPKAK